MAFHSCDNDNPGKNGHGDDEMPNFFVFPMYFQSDLFGALTSGFKIKLRTFVEFDYDHCQVMTY